MFVNKPMSNRTIGLLGGNLWLYLLFQMPAFPGLREAGQVVRAAVRRRRGRRRQKV